MIEPIYGRVARYTMLEIESAPRFAQTDSYCRIIRGVSRGGLKSPAYQPTKAGDFGLKAPTTVAKPPLYSDEE